MKWILVLACAASGPLSELDTEQIDAGLRRSAAEDRSFDQRLYDAARDALGTPYQDGPLGEGPEGKYDTDPRVDFGKVDCVTYVEQTVALATASSYDEMFANLQKIRYHGAKTDFENRNHFMISDWIANNPFNVDVTDELGVETDKVSRTISRKGFFERVKAPGLGVHTPDEEITLSIVPTAKTKQAEEYMPSPSLIVFVGKVDWLFSLHCGLYLRDENGRGRLYHGSLKAGEVVEVDLADYMNQQADRYIGFTAYRIDEPDFAENDGAQQR